MKQADFLMEAATYGVSRLDDKDLLSGILGIANEDKLNGILAVLSRGADMPAHELKELTGLTDKQTSILLAGIELGRRVKGVRCKQLIMPRDIYSVVSYMGYLSEENTVVITLNGAHEVLGVYNVGKGLVDRTLVHPREVFRPAIADNAAAIALAHNHPSGNLNPSDADRNVTGRIKRAGEYIGISLLDHLIVTRDGFYSFREHQEI